MIGQWGLVLVYDGLASNDRCGNILIPYEYARIRFSDLDRCASDSDNPFVILHYGHCKTNVSSPLAAPCIEATQSGSSSRSACIGECVSEACKLQL